jgi:hypothetical protein
MAIGISFIDIAYIIVVKFDRCGVALITIAFVLKNNLKK